MGRDPYQTLGISPSASDEDVHRAYRRLVQLHHPDHNHGSSEAARRFEEVQEAYDRIKVARASAGAPPPRQRAQAPPSSRPAPDPDPDARLEEIERNLREAYAARERAREAARQAAAATGSPPASDEELGYVTTDDSLSKIVSDARAELSDRFDKARDHPAATSIFELIDQLAAKLSDPPKHR